MSNVYELQFRYIFYYCVFFICIFYLPDLATAWPSIQDQRRNFFSVTLLSLYLRVFHIFPFPSSLSGRQIPAFPNIYHDATCVVVSRFRRPWLW